MVANDRDYRHFDAAIVHLRRGPGVRLDDHDDRGGQAACWIVRELAHSTRDEHAHICLALRRSTEAGRAHRFPAPRVELLVAPRHRQRDHAGRVSQTPHVTIEKKWLAVIRAPRLVHTFAIEKAMIEDRDHGVLLVEYAAVDV